MMDLYPNNDGGFNNENCKKIKPMLPFKYGKLTFRSTTNEDARIIHKDAQI